MGGSTDKSRNTQSTGMSHSQYPNNHSKGLEFGFRHHQTPGHRHLKERPFLALASIGPPLAVHVDDICILSAERLWRRINYAEASMSSVSSSSISTPFPRALSPAPPPSSSPSTVRQRLATRRDCDYEVRESQRQDIPVTKLYKPTSD